MPLALSAMAFPLSAMPFPRNSPAADVLSAFRRSEPFGDRLVELREISERLCGFARVLRVVRRVAGEIPGLVVRRARFEIRDERSVQRGVSLVFGRVRTVARARARWSAALVDDDSLMKSAGVLCAAAGCVAIDKRNPQASKPVNVRSSERRIIVSSLR